MGYHRRYEKTKIVGDIERRKDNRWSEKLLD